MSGATGRWVTDAGDRRVMGAWCFEKSCRRLLTAPFYEVANQSHDVLCPSCALAHFGVRPPGTETCGECGASPCDCGSYVWTHAYRMKGGADTKMNRLDDRYFTRAEAIKFRDEYIGADYVKVGPVQRITDPPFDFDEPADRSFQFQCDPPSATKCHNIWCKDFAPAGHSFCSSRCRDYDTKRAAIYHRLESYKTKLARHQDKGMTKAAEVALASEVTWAEQQTKTEVDALERQWRALTWKT